jgi:hypothetical protein
MTVTLRLDPIVRLVACRKLDGAEVLAQEKLDRLLADPEAQRLDLARAHRDLADLLMMADKSPDARPHVFEARRRYRPFRAEPRLAGEVDLLLATYAIEDDRSLEGEEILAEVLATCEKVPSAQLVYARARRLEAHLQVARGEFEAGDAIMQEALAATLHHATETDEAAAERYLLRSQYLFTAGEVAFMVGDRSRAIDLTRAALDLCETRLFEESEVRSFARDRAAHAFRVIGDDDLADRVSGSQKERS